MIVCGVECVCFATRKLIVGDLYLRKTGHEDGKTMEFAHVFVQC
jgi:hypothetical protein